MWVKLATNPTQRHGETHGNLAEAHDTAGPNK
jgi:hypothetical protein